MVIFQDIVPYIIPKHYSKRDWCCFNLIFSRVYQIVTVDGLRKAWLCAADSNIVHIVRFVIIVKLISKADVKKSITHQHTQTQTHTHTHTEHRDLIYLFGFLLRTESMKKKGEFENVNLHLTSQKL
jgi:hypothetical protein